MPPNRRNLYRLLHVQPDAPLEVIKASYRALMTMHHPDKGGDEEQATLINTAYAVLSDVMRRADYDAQLEARQANGPFRGARSSATPAARTRTAPVRDGRGRECPMCALRVPSPMWRDARCSRCRAPLMPAGRPGGMNASGERRALPRVSKSDWALLYVEWHTDAIDVRMRDLSLDGISVYCGGSLPIHSTVRIVGHAFDVVADIVSSRRLANVFTLHARLVTAQFVEQGAFVARTG